MPQFNYEASAPEKGLVTLKFNNEAEAKQFAQALYRWRMVNASNGIRKPIRKEGGYCFRVTPDEFARIQANNANEPTAVFDVFSPMLLHAAECVRKDFMSTPYKGIQDETLEKKNYDEFEMVDYYVAPIPTVVDPNTTPVPPEFAGQPEVTVFRTDVENHARIAESILNRRGGNTQFKERYEVSTDQTRFAKDSATGFELSILQVDNSQGIKDHPQVQAWIAAKDDASSHDQRFLAIKCGNSYRLFGYDEQEKKYMVLDKSKDYKYSLWQLFDKHTAEDTPKKIELDSEVERNVVKDAKCYAHRAGYNAMDQAENGRAYHDTNNIMRQIASDPAFTGRVEYERYIDRTGTPRQMEHYYFNTPQEAQAFEAAVQGAMDENAAKYVKLKTKKEHAAMVTQEQRKMLEQELPGQYIVRPNHGFTHSMRAASYVPVLIEHYKKHSPDGKCRDMDKMDVRMIQLAMLYSVVGRETEVGFGSQAKVQAVRDRHQANIRRLQEEKQTEETAGNDARVAEIEQEISDIEAMIEKEVHKVRAEGEEYHRYRETSALAFLKYADDSGFAQQYKEQKGETIKLQVSQAFASRILKDLERLDLVDVSNQTGFSLRPGNWGKVELEIDQMHYMAAQLYAMSSPDYRKNLSDGVADIIYKAHGLDLLRCYSHHATYPGAPGGSWAQAIGLNLDDTDEGLASAQNVVRFAINALKETGNRVMVDMNEAGEIVEDYQGPDYAKAVPCADRVEACVEHLARIDTPVFNNLAQQLGENNARFSAEADISKIEASVPVIHGVKRSATDRKKVDLRFESQEDAQLFAELMVQTGVLPQSTLDALPDGETLSVERKQFDKMQGFVHYSQVKIPQVHNEEDNLVNENGNLVALDLIQNCKAVTRNFNGASDRSFTHNFGQINDPIHVRPPARLHLAHHQARMGYDRLIVMDMTKSALTDNIKNKAFVIDEAVQEMDLNFFYGNSPDAHAARQARIDAFKKVETKEPPQKFHAFRIKFHGRDPHTNAPTEWTEWVTLGKDDTGRYYETRLNYYKGPDEFRAEEDELLMQTVVAYGYYKRLHRGTEEYLEPDKQIPIDENGATLFDKPEDYKTQEPLQANRPERVKEMGKPVARYEDRGKPKNTKFTKKMPCTLLRPDGKTSLFDPETYTDSIQVGMMFDLDKVHKLGERFIWESDAYTDDRFWLGDRAKGHQRDYTYRWGQNLTLEQLQQHLQEAVDSGKPTTNWNELLLGLSKEAMKGLFVQDDSPVSRITMMNQYMKLKDKYKIDVPVLIVDGTNPPRRYTEVEFAQDLKLLVEAKQRGDFSPLYTTHRVKKTETQNQVLEAFLSTIGYEAIASANPEADAQVEAILDKCQVIGGLRRERAYLEAHWDNADPAKQAALLQRAQALGHDTLVADIQARMAGQPQAQVDEDKPREPKPPVRPLTPARDVAGGGGAANEAEVKADKDYSLPDLSRIDVRDLYNNKTTGKNWSRFSLFRDSNREGQMQNLQALINSVAASGKPEEEQAKIILGALTAYEQTLGNHPQSRLLAVVRDLKESLGGPQGHEVDHIMAFESFYREQKDKRQQVFNPSYQKQLHAVLDAGQEMKINIRIAQSQDKHKASKQQDT